MRGLELTLFSLLCPLSLFVVRVGAYSNRYLLHSWLYILAGVCMYALVKLNKVTPFYWVFVLMAYSVNMYMVSGEA